MIVPASTIAKELADLGVKNIELRDSNYFCPSIEWLRDEFAPWLARNRKPGIADRYDCDDFQNWAIVSAADAIYSRNDLGNVGNSFGGIDVYLVGPKGLLGIFPPDVEGMGQFGAHSTCICRVNDNKYYLLEPQNSHVSLLVDNMAGIGNITRVRI